VRHETQTVEGRPQRLFLIDLGRIAAVLAVIAIHTWSLLGSLPPGSRQWWVAAIPYSASRWAVPLFVMISGGLLLRSASAGSPSTFYRRRLARVMPPAIFWIVAYLLFRATFLHETLSLRSVSADLFLGTPFVHLYFLYIIVGLYLVTPIVHPFVATASRRRLVLAAVGLLAVPVLESGLRALLRVGAGGITGLSYWVPYLGYFVAGLAFTGLRLRRSIEVLVAAVVVGALAGQVFLVYLLTDASQSTGYATGYFSIFTATATVGIYVLVAQASSAQQRSGWLATTVATLGLATFGVYLAHEMLLHWFARDFAIHVPGHLATNRIPTYLMVVVTTFAVVLVAQRVPLARRLV
jgi:surface polysaccharide O-acyltransferase-like enzyme